MVSNSGDLLSYFNEAINDMLQKRTEAFDTPAEIVRIEGGTAWVHMPGGVDETPVQLTVNAKEGDTVQVRVGGGSAWLTGNATAPPTDDTTAMQARIVATTAQEVAQEAQTMAEESILVAGTAMESADGKNTIYRQSDMPTGGEYKVGDTWFDTNDGNKIYLWDGTAWDSALIGTNAIADAAITNAKVSNLDAGKITTGELAAARIDVDDLFAQNITATGIITGATLVGSKIASNSLHVSSIYTDEDQVEWEGFLEARPQDNFTRIGYRETETQSNECYIDFAPDNDGYSSVDIKASGDFFVNANLIQMYWDSNNTAEFGALSINDTTVRVGNSDEGLYTDLKVEGNTTLYGDLSVVGDLTQDITGDANIIRGNSTTIGGRYVRLVTSARSVELFNLQTSGNVGLYDRGNGNWILRSASGQASGETLGDVFIPHPLNVGGRLSAPNIVSGTVTITPTAADTPTGKAVTWSNMGGTPNVVATARTTAPGTVVKAVSVYNKSATGCTIYVTRSNTTATPVDYIAIY